MIKYILSLITFVCVSLGIFHFIKREDHQLTVTPKRYSPAFDSLEEFKEFNKEYVSNLIRRAKWLEGMSKETFSVIFTRITRVDFDSALDHKLLWPSEVLAHYRDTMEIICPEELINQYPNKCINLIGRHRLREKSRQNADGKIIEILTDIELIAATDWFNNIMKSSLSENDKVWYMAEVVMRFSSEEIFELMKPHIPDDWLDRIASAYTVLQDERSRYDHRFIDEGKKRGLKGVLVMDVCNESSKRLTAFNGTAVAFRTGRSTPLKEEFRSDYYIDPESCLEVAVQIKNPNYILPEKVVINQVEWDSDAKAKKLGSLFSIFNN